MSNLEIIFKDLLDYFLVSKDKNHSQANQDLFVLYFTNYIGKKGFFVEIGAGDGVKISNTYLLEKIGWTGIIVDPVCYNNENMKLRKCIKDKRCVYSKTGLKVPFGEVPFHPVVPESSQLQNFSTILKNSNHPDVNKINNTFSVNNGTITIPLIVRNVETISLNDLLKQYNAPNKIDYISIDTEGSEFEILKNFDFNKYDVEAFTIEHNGANFRNDIITLLNYKGYFQMPNLIQGGLVPDYEDWFLKKNNPVLTRLLDKF
jgi:FkbM family methyltransferase